MADIGIRTNTSAEIRRGVLLMVIGSLVVPLLDASAKLLTERHGLSAGEIALIRFMLQTLFAVPLIVLTRGAAGFRVRKPLLNLMRGAILAIGTVCFFLALKAMPLADATAIFFVEPIIVTILSALVLRERIGRTRLVAVLIGFAGTLIVIRPNFVALGPIAALPLMTAFLVALYAILNRRLAETGPPLTMHFYSGVGGFLFLCPVILAGNAAGIGELAFVVPPASAYGLLFLLGLVATIAHLLFIQAYHDTPASILAPLGYLEIPSAVLIGFLVFGDFPDPVTMIGILVIVLSGLVLIRRKRVPTPPPPQP